MMHLAIVERIVDLANVTKKYYYYPDMLGSWSLKYCWVDTAAMVEIVRFLQSKVSG